LVKLEMIGRRKISDCKLMLKTITTTELKTKLLQNYKIIDVRASQEFAQGALPNSVNLPILNDEERALVGTCYKKLGAEKAIELGNQIVSGPNKNEKIKKWQEFVNKNPQTIIACFRGGLRSQITQVFLSELGIEIDRIEKGYKEARSFFSEELSRYCKTEYVKVLTGNTGSGKTQILKQVGLFYPAVDLEELAKHKGSAFGALATPQPAQASFENYLSFEIMKLRAVNPKAIILYEDESRLIGKIHLPEVFFEKLRDAKVIKVKISLEGRIENIFSDYIYPEEAIFQKYTLAIFKIEKKLGSARCVELKKDLEYSKKQFLEQGLLISNKIWIEKLLVWYYDPMYSYSFNQRKPQLEFEGAPEEIIEYLKNKKTKK